MVSKFEDYCWADIMDEETLQIYSAYERPLRVGPNPAVRKFRELTDPSESESDHETRFLVLLHQLDFSRYHDCHELTVDISRIISRVPCNINFVPLCPKSEYAVGPGS